MWLVTFWLLNMSLAISQSFAVEFLKTSIFIFTFRYFIQLLVVMKILPLPLISAVRKVDNVLK